MLRVDVHKGFFIMGFRSSKAGLELIDQARLDKGFSNKYGQNWAYASFTTQSTLKRFWQRKSIQPEVFIAICKAVDCDWHDIVESSDITTSECYVRRPPIEIECHAELRKPKALIRIKAPMRMGKTLLISDLVKCGQRLGYTTIRLDMRRMDESAISNPYEVMQWFCRNVYHQMNRDAQNIDALINTLWNSAYGNNDNSTILIEQLVLNKVESPVILAIDNLDRIFPYRESATDFLGLLRSWHEDDSSNWKKLRIVLAHSTDLYPTLNVEYSPFNVGKTVNLSEFTIEQVQDFVTQIQANWSEADIEKLMSFVGGYPELIRIAVDYHKMNPSYGIQTLLETAPTANGPYYNHLQKIYEKITQLPELRPVLEVLARSKEPVVLRGQAAFYLDSLGLIRLQREQAEIRNNLYRRFIQQQLKDACQQT